MASLALFLRTHLPRLHLRGRRNGCARSDTEAIEDGALVVEEGFDRLPEVLDEMEAIGNLDGVRCTARRTLDRGVAAIPANDGDAGMCP